MNILIGQIHRPHLSKYQSNRNRWGIIVKIIIVINKDISISIKVNPLVTEVNTDLILG